MYHFEEKGSGDSAYFRRVEPDVVSYVGQKIEIRFWFLKKTIETYLHDESIDTHLPKNISFDEKNMAGILDYFFQSDEFKHFHDLFDQSLKKIMKAYKGFPSALHKTKLIVIEFRNEGTLSVFHEQGLFEDIIIGCNIRRLSRLYSDRSNRSDISHELYHVISAFHEGEDVQAKRLRGWETKLFNAVSANREEINRWIKVMEKDIGPGNSPLQHVNLDYFYTTCRRIYWNTVIDTGLNIIALELEDYEYIQNELDYDRYHAYHEEDFAALKEIAHTIIHNRKLTNIKRAFLRNLVVLLEFIAGYNSMPINIIPYALIDDYWRPKKRFLFFFEKKDSNNIDYRKIAQAHISRFESQVKKYFEPEAAEAFLLFWNQYKKITLDMNTRKDPTKPEITREIHNIECLESAKEGYKLLNRLFKKLLLDVKEFS